MSVFSNYGAGWLGPCANHAAVLDPWNFEWQSLQLGSKAGVGACWQQAWPLGRCGERTETPLSGRERPRSSSGVITHVVCREESFDGVLGNTELQTGITETSKVPLQGKQTLPWLHDSCVAFMGRDQWLKAWAGSRQPSS